MVKLVSRQLVSVLTTCVLVLTICLDATPAWFAPALTPILNAAIARGNALLLAAIAQVSTTTDMCWYIIIHGFRYTISNATMGKIASISFSRLGMDPYRLILRYDFLLLIFSICLTHSIKNDLPELRNAEDVKSLTPQQCDAYLAGYGLRHVHGVNDRRRSIRREIGCSVSVVV
jgi:hypothetical protein